MTTAEDWEWRQHAHCRGRITEFDPDLIATRHHWTCATATRINPIAQQLCQGCTVTRQCAADALDHSATGVIAAGRYLTLSTSWGHRRDQLDYLAQVAGRKPTPRVRRARKQPNPGRCDDCGCLTVSKDRWRALRDQQPQGTRPYGGNRLCDTCHAKHYRKRPAS